MVLSLSIQQQHQTVVQGKFSNWSDDEIEDGTNPGKPDWKRVAEEVGRSSEECRAKFKRLSKSK
jgi:hypothetical protein